MQPIQRWIREKRQRLTPIVVTLGLVLGGTTVLAVVTAVPALATTPTVLCPVDGSSCASLGYTDHGYYATQSGSDPTSYWSQYTGDNCTNYVAYIMSSVYSLSKPSRLGTGNADVWEPDAPSSIVSTTPVVGDVAWWGSYGWNDGDGHVAYVEQVLDGGSTVELSWADTFQWADVHSTDPNTSTALGWPNYFISIDGGSSGSSTNSRPAAVARDSADMNAFYRDTSGNLQSAGWNSSTGWATTELASNVSSNPGVVSRSSGSMDVFYRDTSDNLQNLSWNSTSGWSGPVARISDGSVTGDPAVIDRDSSDIDVFFRNSSGNLIHIAWNASTGWGSTQTLVSNGTVAGSPVAVARDSGDIDVFYRDTSNNLEDVGWDWQTGWSGPNVRSSSDAAGDFSVISRNSGEMDVFFTTQSGGLADAYWNSTNGWNVATLVSSGVVGDPTAVARDSSDVDVFYQDGSYGLWDIGWNATNGWVTPVQRAGNVGDNPVVISRDSGDMDVFFRGDNGGFFDAGWNVTNGWAETSLAGSPA